MPRKKRHGKGTAGASSSKHAKHPKNARPSPSDKASKRVDKEETRLQNLQQLQEMFEGKLDAVLVHMIMEDCNYNVEVALETLFKLAGDVPNPEGPTLNQLMGRPQELDKYSDSDSDDSNVSDEFTNDLSPSDHGTFSKPVAGSGTDAKMSSSTGVGLVNGTSPPPFRVLDTAISMAKDLDRNSFSEESVQKVTAGLMAYRETGDKTKMMQLGHLSAVAEMVLEASKREEKQREEKLQEEKQRTQSSKMKFKAVRSRLPVYSATDDRLVGRLSSSSESSGSSSPSHSGDERDEHDIPHLVVNGTLMSDSKSSWHDTLVKRAGGAKPIQKETSVTELKKSQEKSSLNNSDSVPSTYHSLRSTTIEYEVPGATAFSEQFPNRTSMTESDNQKSGDAPCLNNGNADLQNSGKTCVFNTAKEDPKDSQAPIPPQKFSGEKSAISVSESSETIQETPSLNNGDQVPITGPSFSPSLRNHTKSLTPSNTTESQHEETASARPKKARVTFWNNLTTEQDEESGNASDQDTEKDLDKHISFQEDSVDMRENRSERMVGQNNDSGQRSNLIKSQQLPKANNSTERPNVIFPPGNKQMGSQFYVERPLQHDKEPSAMNMPQMPSARPQQRPSGYPQGYVRVGSNPFYAHYSPINVTKAPTNSHARNTHRPYPFDANFIPGFNVGTTHFYVKNISPSLLPRTYHKDGDRPSKVNQGYTRAFFAEMPPGTTTGPYPPHAHFGNIVGFQGQHMRSPPVPRSNVTITEVTESMEEPVTATNTQEESSGPPRWPVIHTNLKRNEYPTPTQRMIPALPPGRVLCLMRGCPGSGKSTLAKSLKGEGVILSTDDFFMINGKYVYDRNLIGEAHDWNQKRAAECLKKGISPIIIDNTNIMSWEMKPYVAMALEHQYQVVIREVDTPWKNKAGELARRNHHGVPKIAIERMLQNYVPNISIESIMNSPDKKKTPEYVAKLDQADPDHSREKGSPDKVPDHQHPAGSGRNGGRSSEKGDAGGRDDGKSPQDHYPEEDNVIDDGWETVGRHRRGHGQEGHDRVGHDEQSRVNHWNHQRTGRGGKKDLNQRNNLKSRSPRRYNNGHPANKHHNEGDGIAIGASGKSNHGSHSSSNKAHSPSHFTKKLANDGNRMRTDGVQHVNGGAVTPSKRGRRMGGAHSPSPNRGYEKKRNLNASHEGQKNTTHAGEKENHHTSPKRHHAKPHDAAVKFLLSEASTSEDPMKRLMNDIGMTNPKQASFSSGQEASSSRIEKDNGLLKNNSLQKERMSPVNHEKSRAEPGIPSPPISQEIVQEVAIEKAIALSETLLQNTQLSVSDDRHDSTSSKTSSSLRGPTLETTEKTYRMLLADDVARSLDTSIHIPGKVDDHDDEQDVSMRNIFDEARDKRVPEKEAIKCDDENIAIENPMKNDTEENASGKEQYSRSMQEGPKAGDISGKQEELHWSCRPKVAEYNSAQGPRPIDEQIDEQSVSAARIEIEVSPGVQQEDCRSPSQCQSRESSRAPTPLLRRTSRRLSGGKSSRRLAPVFTSPTSTAPPVSEDALDWAKFDPSRNIPKPTFPQNNSAVIATPPKVCDSNVATDGQDFSFLQRIVAGTMDPGDLPPGYICKTAIARPLNSDNKSNEEVEIPLSVKLDKGSMTDEIVDEITPEDEKISLMQVCFPSSSTKDLKSLLETCSGDVEMATNLLLDSIDQVGLSAGEKIVVPKEEVPASATEALLAASNISHFGNDIQGAEVSAENNPQALLGMLPSGLSTGSDISLQETDIVMKKTEGNLQMTSESIDHSFENLHTAQILGSSVALNHQPTSTCIRRDKVDRLVSETKRFGSELDQANQIISSNDPKNPLEHAAESVQPDNASDVTPEIVAGKVDSTLETEGQNSKDIGFFKQEIQNEELGEDTDSDDCEEFTNNFYSGATKVVKQKSSSSSSAAATSIDELPSLESFKEDQIELAATSISTKRLVHGLSEDVEKPFVPLDQPVNSVPLNKDSKVPDQGKEETIKPILQIDDSATPEVTDHSESISKKMDKERSGDADYLPESKRIDDEVRTLAGASCTMMDVSSNIIAKESVSVPEDHDSLQTDRKEASNPIPPIVTNQSKSSDVDKVDSDAPNSEETQTDSLSDSDIPWKSSYRNIHSEAGPESGAMDPSEKFQESGEGVYDYLGGMVLQMDAAFALQLQELFGQVGFHLDPDMLSPDDLKVKIGYQVAKQLHSAWSQGLEEWFQSQEKQMEEMLQRDEELARRLQQEENFKKLAKTHRDKKPIKFIPPGSPKRSKKRQKEPLEAGAVNGSQDGMRGEQLLVGGGLRGLQELGGMEPGMNYPPPIQRMEVPELAQIMAEEEIRQQREKKGMWTSGSPVKANTIATKLKRDQLYEAFPDVDKKALDEIFQANDYDLESTKWEVNAVYRESTGPVKDVFSPEAVKEMERRRDQSPSRMKTKGDADCTDGQFQSTEQPEYEDYRAEATLHFKQRDECFKKAAKAYHSGQKELALHYSNQGRLHSMKLKEANRRAAEVILVQRKHETGENKLDLHNLHVEEALQALQEVLIERQRGAPSPGQQRYLEVVTGRGRHSQGGVAKLKPAIAKFLEQRGYRFTTPNPGCLRVYFSS